jgi:hypothetical protein
VIENDIQKISFRSYKPDENLSLFRFTKMRRLLFLKEFLALASVILLVGEAESQLTLSNPTFNFNQPSQCEPINTDILEICKNLAYNETRFPNFMKQKSQEEAAADTRLYLPLIKINCSPGKNKRLIKRNLMRTYLVTFKCD